MVLRFPGCWSGGERGGWEGFFLSRLTGLALSVANNRAHGSYSIPGFLLYVVNREVCIK